MNKLHYILSFVFLLLITSPAWSQSNAIGLNLADLKVKSGDQICMPVTVYGFQRMLSMQYSINFDPQELEFMGVVNKRLPHLTDGNFGVHSVHKGMLTVVWIDSSLKGVTKIDGEAVFTVCFLVKGDKGSKTEVKFTDKPTPFESVNLAEQVVQINTKKGTITVQ